MMTSRLLAASVALFTLTFAAACGSSAPEPPPAAPTGGGEAVDPATAGTLAGRMTFTGTPPPPETLRMGVDAACVAAGGSTQSDAVLVDASGNLQNVFVYVKAGLDPKYSFPAATETVVLDQVGCRYTPRVLGLRVNQPLDVLNSDDTFHNVHGMPKVNVEFNEGQPIKGQRMTRTFPHAEVMMPFKCNVHSWMTAWIGVVDHPFFAVSTADGSYTIAGLPPGTYTIEAWHERFGTQTQQVTIAGPGTVEAAFTFAAPAGAN